MSRVQSVAIIGGGPAGLVLALSLLKRGIKCKIFEGRPAHFSSRAAFAALSLQPNGLRVLQGLDIEERLRQIGYSGETMHIKDLTSGKVMIEGEGIERDYGIKRISGLLEVLESAVKEHGVDVQYGHKFSHVVAESSSGVTFHLADGVQRRADLLIGADGINSAVRQYIAGPVKPVFMGFGGLGAEVPRSALQFSADYPETMLPVSVKHGRTVVNLVPQDNDGSKIFVGKGGMMEARSQAEWNALEADPAAMSELYNQDLEEFPDLVKSAIENIDYSKAYIWPVHVMPKLNSWTSSQHHRVAILGDASHAMSPITGQGANQSFEDAYMLATVLADMPDSVSLEDAMAFWQGQRMRRVHEIMDKLMVPGPGKGPVLETKSKLAALAASGGKRGDAWLYDVDTKKEVDAWVNSFS